MPRYKLTVAYDGTDFHGWQKQHPPGEEPLRTVQGVLEQAVRDVVREEVTVLGASRTDSGVHACGQVAAFTCQQMLPVERMHLAITARLPEDAQVRRAEVVHDDFGPITDCIAKGYRYKLVHPGPRKYANPPLFQRRTSTWTSYPLDAARMNDAARRLIGEHDFASFTRVNHGRESTVRTIHDCHVSEHSPYRCMLEVSGSGFLYNMVRIIAGTLIDVGRGKMEPEAIDEIVRAADRGQAGPTLPPQGLCLMWVKYPDAPPPEE